LKNNRKSGCIWLPVFICYFTDSWSDRNEKRFTF